MAHLDVFQSPTWIGLLLALVVWLFVGSRLSILLAKGLSWILDLWLGWKYPIKSAWDNSPIPGCPYEFPNGQGDAAKFLYGKQNSEAWGRQYGSIFRIWSGMAPEIVLTRPDHLVAFFKDSQHHTKASSNNSGYFMSQLLGQCLGLISGERWRAVKATFEQLFLRSACGNHLDLVQRRVRSHFKELWESGRLASGTVNPVSDFKILPFMIVAEIVYGPLTEELERRLRGLAPEREALFRHVLRGGLSRFRVARYLPTKANRELAAFREKWHNLNQDLFHSATGRSSSAPIIQLFRALEDGAISREELYHTLDEILFANLDVTMGVLGWNMVFLAANPQIQEQVRAEACSKSQDGAFEEYIQDSSSLLSACVRESSRLRPLAAFSVPQAAPTDRVVGGYLIPAGTNAMVDAYALNIRNPFWGTDSAQYRPGRFLEHSPTELRYNYWRFGFGPRRCLGRYLADVMVGAFIAHLVCEYELALDGNGGKDKDGLGWERIEYCWINHPSMTLRCVPRVVQ